MDTAKELIEKLNEMSTERDVINYAEFQIRALLLIGRQLEAITDTLDKIHKNKH